MVMTVQTALLKLILVDCCVSFNSVRADSRSFGNICRMITFSGSLESP